MSFENNVIWKFFETPGSAWKVCRFFFNKPFVHYEWQDALVFHFAASPRTVTLAKPVERPAGIETDLREDAFTVSPMALKAKCSKRLKFLARPKRRKWAPNWQWSFPWDNRVWLSFFRSNVTRRLYHCPCLLRLQ